MKAGGLTMEFITQDEKAQLEGKLADLKAKRPVISQRIGEARALGDLSENADYHAAREDQGLNEAEIRRLEERLKTAQVAVESDIPDDMVFVGTVVKLRDTDNDDVDLYKLVGEASGNFDADEIEVTASSPMGEALLKARVGDTVKVDLPRGTKRFEVMEIV
jgi:transcription elongation factor GreA